MLAVIEEVEIVDQETAVIVVSVDNVLHALEFHVEDLYDVPLDKIRRALREKLYAESTLSDLVGQAFDMQQKAYA